MCTNSCTNSVYFDKKVHAKVLMLLYTFKRFSLFILGIRNLRVLSNKYYIVQHSINISGEPYVVSNFFYVALGTIVDDKYRIRNTVPTIVVWICIPSTSCCVEPPDIIS